MTAEVPSTEDTLRRSRALLQELEAFDRYLKERKKKNTIAVAMSGLYLFQNNIKSEIKAFERLAEAEHSTEKTQHALVSSNLPHYEALWNTAKRARGLVGFHKRVYWGSENTRPNRLAPSGKHPPPKNKDHSVQVDIVARDGLEWIKVSTITSKRLLFDIAGQGWERDLDSEEGESDTDARNDGVQSVDDKGGVPLLRTAECLAKASRTIRIRYKYPRVRLVLPRIQPGTTKEIDALLDDIRATGAIVECGSECHDAPALEDVLCDLITDESADVSEVLNIDCTVLIALTSDISHTKVPDEPRSNMVKDQVKAEKKEKLMPSMLYPVMAGRSLVCTEEAAKRMRELVDQIGTESEKARAAVLMGDCDDGGEKKKLTAEFQKLSIHPVPPGLQLPIEIVDKDVEGACLPEIAAAVAAQLNDINRSVFLYGWASGRSTLSSNRVAARTIERVIEDYGTDEDQIGPHIWLLPTARSLFTREKNRSAGESPATGASPTTDG
ncbi:hypothetical protein B0A49_00105 [Cryomyces minteri]|uniref:DUF1308 domain-containing protein n=1 Tax=Cryomyces minteri TaxID=331657 RepID=A0A4U0XWT9_9PEZI|nr:hypothetical protein B0A49_00105 [Cryomyces minteri]